MLLLDSCYVNCGVDEPLSAVCLERDIAGTFVENGTSAVFFVMLISYLVSLLSIFWSLQTYLNTAR